MRAFLDYEMFNGTYWWKWSSERRETMLRRAKTLPCVACGVGAGHPCCKPYEEVCWNRLHVAWEMLPEQERRALTVVLKLEGA